MDYNLFIDLKWESYQSVHPIHSTRCTHVPLSHLSYDLTLRIWDSTSVGKHRDWKEVDIMTCIGVIRTNPYWFT